MRPNIKAGLLAVLALFLTVEIAVNQTVTPSGGSGGSGATTCGGLLDASAFCSGTNAASLTGTVASARIAGSYTGITGVGTLTAGTWSATTIAVTVGGSGLTAVSTNQLFVGTGVNTFTAKTLPNCVDTGGNHLNFTTATNEFSCGTSGGGSGISQLTGDVTAGPGSGSVAATLATTQTAVHTWTATQTISQTTVSLSALVIQGSQAATATVSPVVSVIGDWNVGAGNIGGTAILLNMTNTASSASTKLLDLQTGGVTQFNVTRGGGVVTAGQLTVNSTIAFTGNLDAGATSIINWNARGQLTSPASASVQIGVADTGAPSAQTLSVTSVVAGTANTAGVNWTLTGSRSTGSAQGGDIILSVSPAGGAGSSQNTLVEAYRAYAPAAALRTRGTTVAGLPTCNSGATGSRLHVTDSITPVTFSMNVTAGGAQSVPVYCTGTNWIVLGQSLGPAPGACSNALDFSAACNSQYIGVL